MSAHTFGELVKQYILQHDLSYHDFAVTLGYKSKTSISRIIQDETSYDLRLQFYKRLCKYFPLSSRERKAFEDVLHHSRLSNQDQELFAYFSSILHTRFDADNPADISYASISSDSAAPSSLSKLIEHRAQYSYSITASVFGTADAAFMSALYQILSSCGCSFRIQHYIFPNDTAMEHLRCVTNSAPFLFDSHYVVYCHPASSKDVMLNRHLIVHYDHEDGNHSEDVFALHANGMLAYGRQINAHLSAFYEHVFLSCAPKALPLKNDAVSQSERESAETFVSMQKQIAELEENCSSYILRKGLPLEFIPPQIFQKAFLPEQLSSDNDLFSTLMHTQQKRHHHLFARKHPLHYILSQNAFQRFIWTGRLVNHPSFLRPFSPKERYDILVMILEQLEQNPYFSIRFATEEMPAVYNHLSLSCYQHIHRASAHQAQANDCLLVQPGILSPTFSSSIAIYDMQIASSFSLYFREELSSKYTLTSKKTWQFLYNMLNYLQAK